VSVAEQDSPRARRRTGRGGQASGKAEPEPVRVLAFLLPLREPQTAAEIARGIYQDAAGPSEINRVRSAAESSMTAPTPREGRERAG
jgi:hypothetical protein